jgi:hypothetical protein
MMKTRLALGALLIGTLTLSYYASLPSQPSFNGTTAGCGGGNCHSNQSGIVTASSSGALAVRVTVSGTTGNVAGELVDNTGAVVDVIDKTSSNPFTLTAPGPGTYTVNAGFKSPQRRWDSTSVTLTLTDVGDAHPEAPVEGFQLNQNYPNPFNPSTVISFVTPSEGEVRLSVYNCLGQKVADVFRGRLEGGYHRMTFENPGLPSGVYLYRLDMGTHSASRKLHILK